MGLILITFLPGRAVKAKINLFLSSLAVGMDNIGKTMTNTWILGSVSQKYGSRVGLILQERL